MDSFHECLQEYGEGLEVVRLCLEPEEASIKDEEVSALGDLSIDDIQYKDCQTVVNGDKNPNEDIVNGINGVKSYKSHDSLDNEDDLTITEDDVLVTPRELPDVRSKSADRKVLDGDGRQLSKEQSKDISTSDEMVFAVTPTGLERISFERYWRDSELSKLCTENSGKVRTDKNRKECSSPNDETPTFCDAPSKFTVHENTLLYIDHDIEGYETCLDDDTYSAKMNDKTDGRKFNDPDKFKADCKQNKNRKNKDNDSRAKSVPDAQNTTSSADDESSYGRPYVQEHIIKQMQSLRIEPLNVNICTKKNRKRSPSKPSKNEKRQCIEYYNDQAECLEEYKRLKKLEEEERKCKEEQHKRLQLNLAVMERKLQLKKKEPSEESTDIERGYVPGCHKCFLENYAYAITKAYIAEANACKYCEVIRDMLNVPKSSGRRLSAPALGSLDSGASDTEDEDLLMAPMMRGRRTSAGPLRYIVPTRRLSYAPQPTMTVTVSPDRLGETLAAQRWGPPREVTLERYPGRPLGVTIVGGKVDIISSEDGSDAEKKAIFGIFIKNVVAGSPASASGDLHTGDRILEVDGMCVRSAAHEKAVQLIKAAGQNVTLTVQSLVQWNTDSSDVTSTPPSSPAPSAKNGMSTRMSPARQPPVVSTVNTDVATQPEIKITVTSEGESEISAEKESIEQPKEVSFSSEEKKEYSDEESSEEEEEEDERHLQGRMLTEKGQEIDRASAGAIRRSKEEKEKDKEEEDEFGYTTNTYRSTRLPRILQSVRNVRK